MRTTPQNHKSQAYKCLKQISENDGVQIPTVGLTGTLMQVSSFLSAVLLTLFALYVFAHISAMLSMSESSRRTVYAYWFGSSRHIGGYEEVNINCSPGKLAGAIDFLIFFVFSSKCSFMEYTSKPIMLARAKDAKENIKRIAKQREEELSRTLSPVFIERKKEVCLFLNQMLHYSYVRFSHPYGSIGCSQRFSHWKERKSYILWVIWGTKKAVSSPLISSRLRNAENGKCAVWRV